jgi:hypothetical protein
VIDYLKSGIGDRLRVVRHVIPLHLHAKIYGFSHPRPVVLAGSFNPSGNVPENPAIIAEIGDQDRGHNLLVEVADEGIVTGLFDWVRALHRSPLALQWRMRTRAITARGRGAQALLFPRTGGDVLMTRFETLAPGSKLRIAASHLRDPLVAKSLRPLARRGVCVDLLTSDAGRRSPPTIERALVEAGVNVMRLGDTVASPMHCKFVLAQSGGERWSAFGSYNLTKTSRWLNYELLGLSSDIGLWDQLDRRWSELAAASSAT